MLVPDQIQRVGVPQYVLITVTFLLFAYPILTLTVAGAVNTIFFLLFLISVGVLLNEIWPRAVTPTTENCSTDPLSKLAAWLYFLSMAALPIAVFISQWANHRWGWHYYDAVSRFFLSAPIFFALRKIPAKNLMSVWPGFIIGALVACGLAAWFPHNWGGGDNLERVGSSFVNPIHFGDIALTLGVISAFGIGCRGNIRPPGSALYYLIATLALIAGVYASILSGSRGGWIAVPAFALLAYSINRTRVSFFALNSGMFVMFALAIFTYSFIPEIHHRIDMIPKNLHDFYQGNENTSIGVRFQLWKAAFLIFFEHPLFGVGMGGFKALMGPMQLSGQLTQLAADFGRQEVHSELLSRLSQLGIVGFAAIMAVYFVPGWLFWQRLRALNPASRASARMGLVLVSGFFVYGLTVETFDLTMTAAFYALTTAVLLAAAYPQNSRTYRQPCSAS
jgi:O-antigen ligase